MHRILFISIILFLFQLDAAARHIKGGWVQYEYLGAGSAAATSQYKITITVYRSCPDTGPMPTSLNIYDAVSFIRVFTVTTNNSNYVLQGSPTKTSFDPCLSNPPTICYQIYTYTTTVTLADNTNGYTVVASDANRISGIVNITNSVSTGISFVGNIPGNINGIDYRANSSPTFEFKDTAIVCYNANFTYQFSATDKDNDSLTYSFGNGINGTQNATAPPYSSLNYTAGFSGSNPLGPNATIDAQTGLISGKAPSGTGEYVIAVYVQEWRNGVQFNSTRKELQIIVGDCSLSAATLKPSYVNCNSFVCNFQNESLATNINSYLWDFGVSSISTDVSNAATPTYTYADTGTYTIKLTVGNSGGCKDSTTSIVKVYPGFSPNFTVTGSCFQIPFQFTDSSFVKYGSISSWLWDFGDTSTLLDSSTSKNTSYLYPATGNVTATMTINSTLGCSGSFSKTIPINDKPFLFLPFTDTLICSIDSLKLPAQTNGVYRWSPQYRISDTSALTPIVYPKDTTTYTITVSDKGCIDSASVKVNVLQFITVKLGLDTGICKTDSIVLKPISDALSYRWRENNNANSLTDYFTKFPIATPLSTTKYFVTANLGYCQDSTSFTVNVSPYPQAALANDTVICYGTRLAINANFTGAFYQWTNTASLLNTNSLSPIAGPTKTTSYIFSAIDTLYCPKKVSDTITIRVVQPLKVFAGKDTTVSLGQPLQLLARGADSSFTYLWTPNNYLDNEAIYNPIAIITSTSTNPIRYIMKATSPEGCISTDDINVKIYDGGPDIIVPSAFTPNADGRNDILKPVLIGISKLDYFEVYNRWGQLIYSSSQINAGWDGTFNNTQQPSGAYVYSAQGQDFLGKIVYKKGTAVLIR